MNTMEPNIIAFNNETMQFRLSLDTNTMHVSKESEKLFSI